MGILSANPLLQNLEDLIVEEASGYEDELLGRNVASDADKYVRFLFIDLFIDFLPIFQVTFERDERLAKTLDALLVYLRVVHSVDFYSHTDYPSEDDMPNRFNAFFYYVYYYF